ncbi:MAG: mitofilin family membrane protein [Rhodospirillales bacterium]
MSKVPDSSSGKGDAKPSPKTEAKSAAQSDAKTAAVSQEKTNPAAKDDGSAKKPGSAEHGKPTAGAAGKPADKAAPKAAEPASSGGFMRGFIIAAVLVVVVVAGGMLTVKDWWPAVEPYIGEWVEPLLPEGGTDEEAARLAEIEQRMDAIEAAANDATSADALADLEAARAQLSRQIDDIMVRLDVAERALSSLRSTAEAMTTAGGGAASGELAGRIDEIDALSRNLAASRAESQAALDALAREVEALAQQRAGASANSVQAQAMVLTTGQVRRAVIAGGPFDEPLIALEAIAGDDPEIQVIVDRLRPNADTGVATVETLRREFAEIAGPLVQAGRALEESDWVSSAFNKVTSLVSVRRTDGSGDPASADAIVAAAENRLAAGNLAGAVDVLGNLPAAAQEKASGWLANANARLDVDKALDDLHALALRRLQTAAASGQG